MNQTETKKPLPLIVEHAATLAANTGEHTSAGASPCILLGILDAVLAERLAAQIKVFARKSRVITASKLEQLRDLAASSRPELIFLDSDVLGSRKLSEAVQQLVTIAPVVVLASVNSHAELSRLVAGGEVEFIGRIGDFVPLAAALLERRVNRALSVSSHKEREMQPRPRIGELFRHEINNPLTGILGNVELVLAHREHLSMGEVQRLQTVVDLAVRLRESIRRIGAACEQNLPSATSI